MSDLIGIAASGLRGYNAALDAVGENVAGASIPGYARRSVALAGVDAGSPGPLVRASLTSLGVDVTGLKRAADQFLAADARSAASNDAALSSQSAWLGEIQSALTAGGQDIGSGLTAFYNAAQGLAAEPGSNVARNQFLSAAGDVARRFETASAAFDQTGAAIGKTAEATVDGINTLTGQLAKLNGLLRRTEPDTAEAATLQDQRDQLLTHLSQSVGISVAQGERGTVTVRLGNPTGQSLVDGTTATRLTLTGDKLLIGKARADVTTQTTGGSLGGTFAAARALDETRTRLDQLASDFATAINSAHETGDDALGNPGGALFLTQTANVDASPANTGTAGVTTSVAAGGVLAAGGYTLSYDGPSGGYTLAHMNGSNPISGTGTLMLDGLTVSLAGIPANGDNFSIEPRAGAAGIALAITDPAKVAAADPWIA